MGSAFACRNPVAHVETENASHCDVRVEGVLAPPADRYHAAPFTCLIGEALVSDVTGVVFRCFREALIYNCVCKT